MCLWFGAVRTDCFSGFPGMNHAHNNNMKHLRTGGQFSKGSRGRGGAFVWVDLASPNLKPPEAPPSYEILE